jgi:hypothetical protein
MRLNTPGIAAPHLQHVHAQHPPDQEYGNDRSNDVNDPVANGFRSPKVEHLAMVAGGTSMNCTSRCNLEPAAEWAAICYFCLSFFVDELSFVVSAFGFSSFLDSLALLSELGADDCFA